MAYRGGHGELALHCGLLRWKGEIQVLLEILLTQWAENFILRNEENDKIPFHKQSYINIRVLSEYGKYSQRYTREGA